MNQIAKFEKVSLEQFIKDFEPIEHDEAIIKQIYNNIRLPERATVGSAGYDFFIPFRLGLNKGESIVIPTGIKCKIEPGWVLQIYPRSGHGFKYGIHLANTVGIIDSDYYNAKNDGHIMIKIISDSSLAPDIIHYKEGEGFCQGLFLPFGVTTDDTAEGERTGGFGSTTKR